MTDCCFLSSVFCLLPVFICGFVSMFRRSPGESTSGTAGQPFVYPDITRQSYRQYRLFLPARTASLRQGPLP